MQILLIAALLLVLISTYVADTYQKDDVDRG